MSLGFDVVSDHLSAAVITIKHVSTFVNKVENSYVIARIFDLIDKCRYVFYGYDGRAHNLTTVVQTARRKLLLNLKKSVLPTSHSIEQHLYSFDIKWN
jgi:hypothetical protein